MRTRVVMLKEMGVSVKEIAKKGVSLRVTYRIASRYRV